MKQLVLLGAGHAHALVLNALAAARGEPGRPMHAGGGQTPMSPLPGVAVTVVSPVMQAPYSGMVPGWLGGQYRWDEIVADFGALSARAGATMLAQGAVALDPAARQMHLADGRAVSYDILYAQLDPDLPHQPVTGALAISGLYDLEPLRHAPCVKDDLRLTPASVARLSPAFFPRPKQGRLQAVVGLDESDEFLRQNALIRDVWGPTAVPVCETVPGRNHFDVLNALVEPDSRVHELALRLLDLR